MDLSKILLDVVCNTPEEKVKMLDGALTRAVRDIMELRGLVSKLTEEKELLEERLKEANENLAGYEEECEECDGCARLCSKCSETERRIKAEDKLSRIGVLFKRFSDEVKAE